MRGRSRSPEATRRRSPRANAEQGSGVEESALGKDLDLGPDSRRPGMVTVEPHVAGNEGFRVDEDHFFPYRYLSCFAERSRGAGPSKMTSSKSGSSS